MQPLQEASKENEKKVRGKVGLKLDRAEASCKVGDDEWLVWQWCGGGVVLRGGSLVRGHTRKKERVSSLHASGRRVESKQRKRVPSQSGLSI